MEQKMKIGIIYGGKSSEHEVSLSTAKAIMNAIDRAQFNIIPYYIQLNGTWVKGQEPEGEIESVEQLRLSGTPEQQPNVLRLKEEIDIAFPVIHGPYGEDGTLQGLLEMADVPYVGTGVLGSSLGMDKVAMKNVFGEIGIPQCKYLSFLRAQLEQGMFEVVSQIEESLGYPCFVKPANMGSSVGISKAKNRESLLEALQLAARFDRKIIVEEFVSGRELEIGVLGNDELKTSVIGEIVSVNEFYDYEAKYKNTGTKLHIPAHIPDYVKTQIEEMGKKAFHGVDATGLSRIDFFWDEKNDKVLINEINTMPGFTPFSMYPMLFQAAGISYGELIHTLVQLGFERYDDRHGNAVAAEKLN
ncbi:D-alanine--D-alanine ligase [Ammoniphilus sp. CFH 90114]|uniref:D-alanine--D-alanine ligase n=1 Tax=Ammoniphilus sp. CFH 90114 TaxID=2493665 RepID=UPI00100E4E65|nr:D-alanine--D-alanine ligase [Ammoniphilus sp. CFH 90114]RXT14825.1 D-alanine--D-alanine ligase [Ammoniphilus sp. CFH 90114]